LDACRIFPAEVIYAMAKKHVPGIIDNGRISENN
jgi:hypothetical protein